MPPSHGNTWCPGPRSSMHPIGTPPVPDELLELAAPPAPAVPVDAVDELDAPPVPPPPDDPELEEADDAGSIVPSPPHPGGARSARRDAMSAGDFFMRSQVLEVLTTRVPVARVLTVA